ncbi:hypothetical protein [Microbacterium sp. 10M-3C3]|jgi:hypothetical protein|uniref:hypothetical protein n=1 Tax=Microbacterium sp. 10M-3C3 TaxID=2483401 RepID=UPI000F62FAD6|nr:hypothetical protein [Microbacterium sp. 10M-3C3]
MNRRHSTLIAAAALAPALALTLAACGAENKPDTVPTTLAPPTAVATSPAPSPTRTTATPDADPACETILPEDTVADFEQVGWTAQADVFRIGGTEVPGGIQCTWGDYTVATDHVQVFGWAPIDDSDAEAAEQQLVSEGWRREEGNGGVYVTESAESAIATDEDGYGFTYFFGDGFVKVSDTKQGLILIEWPPK